MYSRCEYCQLQQKVTVKQLRRHRGLLKCKSCRKPFDALASLSEKPDNRIVSGPSENALPWMVESVQPVNRRLWAAGTMAMLLLLIVQIGYFEGVRLLQFPQMQALANQFCQPVHCLPPVYRNLKDWSVSHSDLQAYLGGRLLFTAAISNQSDVKQPFPALKLTLLGFNGQPVAERVFLADQYVDIAELDGEETRELQLWLAEPAAAVGGYNVSVL